MTTRRQDTDKTIHENKYNKKGQQKKYPLGRVSKKITGGLVQGGTSFADLFCCFCHSCVVLSVSCSLVVNCWALLYVVLSCDFSTYLFDVLGQVWYMILSIPDLCPLLYVKPVSWRQPHPKFCGCLSNINNP